MNTDFGAFFLRNSAIFRLPSVVPAYNRILFVCHIRYPLGVTILSRITPVICYSRYNTVENISTSVFRSSFSVSMFILSSSLAIFLTIPHIILLLCTQAKYHKPLQDNLFSFCWRDYIKQIRKSACAAPRSLFSISSHGVRRSLKLIIQQSCPRGAPSTAAAPHCCCHTRKITSISTSGYSSPISYISPAIP